jgi:DNA-binding GntR family transcriptional regulator
MARTALSLRASVLPELRRRIVEGDYPLGAQLSENALALEFGMSRTPVREALMALEAEGLVDVRPQRGSYVFSIDIEETRQLCDLRGILETGALVLAVQRQVTTLARDLSGLIAAAESALRHGKLRDCERLDMQFHETLIAGSDNRFLIESYRRIEGRVNALRFRLPAQATRIESALEQHRTIADAVARGSIDDALNLLTGHVRNVFRLLAEGTSQTADLLQP